MSERDVRVGPLTQPIACNEVYGYWFRSLDCVIVCGVPVAGDYIPNIVASVDMSNNVIDCPCRRDTTVSSQLGFGRV